MENRINEVGTKACSGIRRGKTLSDIRLALVDGARNTSPVKDYGESARHFPSGRPKTTENRSKSSAPPPIASSHSASPRSGYDAYLLRRNCPLLWRPLFQFIPLITASLISSVIQSDKFRTRCRKPMQHSSTRWFEDSVATLGLPS